MQIRIRMYQYGWVHGASDTHTGIDTHARARAKPRSNQKLRQPNDNSWEVEKIDTQKDTYTKARIGNAWPSEFVCMRRR